MSEIKEKRNWGLDIHLHIPMPTFQIKITGETKVKEENEPLHHTITPKEEADHGQNEQ